VVPAGAGDAMPDRDRDSATHGTEGLLDLKGAGVSPDRAPLSGDHENGLEHLGVALTDFAMQKAVDEILRRAAPGLWSVPTYAVLDLGFDILQPPTLNSFKGLAPGHGWNRRGSSPAGMHVRRAHRRPLYGKDLPDSGSSEQKAQFEIEMLLRNYGITSTTVGTSFLARFATEGLEVYYGPHLVSDLSTVETAIVEGLRRPGTEEIRLEGVNVQMSRGVQYDPIGGQLVDFGQFNVREDFQHPVASLVCDRPLRLGGILWPDHPTFVQPDPELALPTERWGRIALCSACFDLAQRFRNGEIQRSDVECFFGSLVSEAVSNWPL